MPQIMVNNEADLKLAKQEIAVMVKEGRGEEGKGGEGRGRNMKRGGGGRGRGRRGGRLVKGRTVF